MNPVMGAKAFATFLEGDNFENVVRLAISPGEDCDTLTNIVAAMAEGFYGADKKSRKKWRKSRSKSIRSPIKLSSICTEKE